MGKGKTAVVTGAARGLGSAIVLKLAEDGMDLVLADLEEDSLSETARLVAEKGAAAVCVAGDVSVPENAETIMEKAVQETGGLHVLVNNAGIVQDSLLHKMTREQWVRVIDVNLFGTFYCLQAAAKRMRAQQYGRIINISSISWMGNIGQARRGGKRSGVPGIG